MVNPNKKSKSPFLVFIGFLAVIMILMFISHIRSNYMRELRGIAGGITNLYTTGNHLVAISGAKDIYLWDWNNLDKLPQKSSVNAEKLLCLNNEKIIWIPSGDSSIAVVSNLNGNEVYKKLSFGYDKQCKYMGISGNGRFIIFALTDKANVNHPKKMQLEVLDINSYELSNVSEIDLNNAVIQVNKAAISNEGRFIGLVGNEKEAGWICLIDTQIEKILWQKQVDWSNLLTEIVFSSDSDKIYCTGNGTQISCYNNNGQFIKSWKRDDYNIPANKTKSMSALALARNGKFLAVSSNPSATVWIWDITIEHAKPIIIGSENTYITAITLSPNLDMMVTASFKVIDKMEVWKVPKDILN